MNSVYPQGFDCVWIASDQNGKVGAFITAGEGPIPSSAFHFEEFREFLLEEMIDEMRRLSKANVVVDVPRPDSFICLAERGFFVYDWGEFIANPIGERHSYRLVAVPSPPATIDVLPCHLAKMASSITFSSLRFENVDVVNPRDNMDCVEQCA